LRIQFDLNTLHFLAKKAVIDFVIAAHDANVWSRK
jgi:hypothetical protein